MHDGINKGFQFCFFNECTLRCLNKRKNKRKREKYRKYKHKRVSIDSEVIVLMIYWRVKWRVHAPSLIRQKEWTTKWIGRWLGFAPVACCEFKSGMRHERSNVGKRYTSKTDFFLHFFVREIQVVDRGTHALSTILLSHYDVRL